MPDIDLFASWRNIAKGGRGKKFAIWVEGSGSRLLFHPDDKEIAGRLALAIAEQARENLLAGRSLDGTPLGGIDADTVERRQDLAAQGARGGEAAPRYVDEDVRGRARRRYARKYTATRGRLAGRSFTPVEGGTRGVVSGMLAAAIFARPARDGKAFIIDAAGSRSRALAKVIGKIPMWSAGGMQQEKVRIAMREAAHRVLGKSLSGILESVLKTVEHVQEIADAGEE